MRVGGAATEHEDGQGPRQLVVLSGKGGTGKTSVVAALATLAPEIVLADCDVDAADLHLVLQPVVQRRETFISGKEAHIASESCAVCGHCAQQCRFKAIRLVDGPGGRAVYSVDTLACEGCGLCTHVCPFGAVTLVEAERGEWYVSETRHGPLVHARLNVGGENSGKLVTLVRQEVVRIAREQDKRLVLVDGPPGIGCPVIASTTGAHLVLAVTEPTVSGAHDLLRLIELVEIFNVPLAVCINRADLDPDMASEIRETCGRRGLPVVGELSYDEAVIQAQVQGRSVVEQGGGTVAEQIAQMWETLEKMLLKVEA